MREGGATELGAVHGDGSDLASGVAGDDAGLAAVAAHVEAGERPRPATGRGALEDRELVAERGDRVAGTALPAVLQVGRYEHRRPDHGQDHKYQHGGHASVAVLRSEERTWRLVGIGGCPAARLRSGG